ncbi:hypothetical protein HPB47_013394, partial [Ixodes persulcatus]
MYLGEATGAAETAVLEQVGSSQNYILEQARRSSDQLSFHFSLTQAVPVLNKTNPVGLKSFILAGRDGLIYDFEMYKGKETFPDESLG